MLALVSEINCRCFLYVVGAPWRCGVLMTQGGIAGIGLGHLLEGEHDSAPQIGVDGSSPVKNGASPDCFVVVVVCQCVSCWCCLSVWVLLWLLWLFLTMVKEMRSHVSTEHHGPIVQEPSMTTNCWSSMAPKNAEHQALNSKEECRKTHHRQPAIPTAIYNCSKKQCADFNVRTAPGHPSLPSRRN